VDLALTAGRAIASGFSWSDSLELSDIAVSMFGLLRRPDIRSSEICSVEQLDEDALASRLISVLVF
jgi:hypothetical protein